MTCSRPVGFALLMLTPLVWGAEPIRDEGLRREILRAVWPGARATVFAGKFHTISYTDFPDALKGETVYWVSSPPQDQSEDCAADDLVGYTAPSRRRELRFRAWVWPSRPDDLVTVLQYKFPDAHPSFGCQSVARLVHLTRHDGHLQVQQSFVFEMTHHNAVEGAEFIDLTGNGKWGLVTESDFGGGGTEASEFVVFALEQGRLQQWLNVPSRWRGWDAYTQTLDVARTRATGAAQFCFTKTMWVENGEQLAKPRITQPCYPRFTGWKIEER